jgi:hypothetical protein
LASFSFCESVLSPYAARIPALEHRWGCLGQHKGSRVGGDQLGAYEDRPGLEADRHDPHKQRYPELDLRPWDVSADQNGSPE